MIERSSVFIAMVAALVVGMASAVFISSDGGDVEVDEVTVFGLELEKLVNLFNALLALSLSILTFSAFRRENRSRLAYIALAFLIFSVKNFLISSELFIQEVPAFDPISTMMEFAALLTIFYGILKK